MVDELETKENVKIIEEIKEVKKEDVPVEEGFSEEVEEELAVEDEESYLEEGNFKAPIIESEEIIEEKPRKFSLDKLKDLNVPSKKKKSTSKNEEFYSSKSSEALYSGGASANDFYQSGGAGIEMAGSDFYNTEGADSMYNFDSSEDGFYKMSAELEEESEDQRFETVATLENKFKEDKKDDLMFRS